MRCNQGSLQRINALLMQRIGLVEKQLGALKFVAKHREGIILNPMMFMDLLPLKTYELLPSPREKSGYGWKIKARQKAEEG